MKLCSESVAHGLCHRLAERRRHRICMLAHTLPHRRGHEVPVAGRQAVGLDVTWRSSAGSGGVGGCLHHRRVNLLVRFPLLRAPARPVRVGRVDHVLFLHPHRRVWVVAALPRELAHAGQHLGLDAGDFVDPVCGDARFGEGESLDPHGHRVFLDLEHLRWLRVGRSRRDGELFGSEEGRRVGCLSGDARLNALFFHGVEIVVAVKQMCPLARSVLRHFSRAVLAPHLREFLSFRQCPRLLAFRVRATYLRVAIFLLDHIPRRMCFGVPRRILVAP